jgi:4-hydroxy-tetrahydrodipicolinate reductase
MNIGIVGCAGRMGRMLIRSVLETDGAELCGGVEVEGSAALGEDLGVLAGGARVGLAATVDPQPVFDAADCIIDFTTPKATAAHADLAVHTSTALVIGTTGLAATDQAVIDEAARSVAVVQAANFSVGVTVLLGLVEQAAAVMGPEYDIEIVEMHHRGKVDAPSGTALAAGEAAARGRGISLAENSQRVRDGHTGPRETGVIGFATLRGGDVIGEHTTIFAGPRERITLGHIAGDRLAFSDGAVRAALWASQKPAGLYDMRDVLGLKG